jgi:hypothetical protein
VKKVVAAICLFIVLFSQTELHQLLHAPKLYSHFIEHKEKKPEISFLQFLKMHYTVADDNDGDGSKDQELPFKSTECAIGFSVASFMPQDFTEFKFFTHETEAPVYIYASSYIPNSHIGLIWQPPKVS